MYQRRSSHRFHRVLASAACCCAIVILASKGHAYHTKQSAPTYLTGHVLPKGEFRLGLDYQGYGLVRRLSINTSLTGLLVWPFTGVVVPNLTLRVGAIRIDPFYVAVESGVAFVFLSKDTQKELGNAIGEDVSTDFFFMIPIILGISYHPNDRFLISADLSYFYSNASARVGASSESAQVMVAGQSLQVGATFQYAINKVVATTFKWRMVAWTPTVPFEFSGELDSTTEFEFYGTAQITSLSNAYQVIPGVALSWRIFNLRLGLGYGNVFLPTVGLVSSYRGIFPDIELYFRF